MKIEDILSRFEGVEQKAPDSWMARCPAHGDNNPSLSITRKPDGKVLMHCFTGCTVEEICAAVGLKMSDLMPERPKVEKSAGGKKKKDLGKWVCDYVYQDEDGSGIYKIARYEKDGLKTFMHLRPDTGNRFGWSYGIHDKRNGKLLIKYRCPFHLPRVVAAAKSGKTIFILEGEKDVLNFEAATGCAATCNSGGALKWGEDFPADWIKWFQGAKGIVIIADNDPEFKTVVRKYRGQVTSKDMPHWKGQKHAADVRAKLVKAGFPAEKIKLMVMPGVEVEQGVTKRVKDFSDWAAARKAVGLSANRAAFQDAYKAAEPWPEKWNWTDEELSRSLADFAAAEKRSRRQTASEGGAAAAPAQEKEGAGAQTISDASASEHTGRFGAPLPSDPLSAVKKYKVCFTVGRVGEEIKQCEIIVGANDDLPRTISAWHGIIGAAMKRLDGKMGAKEKNDISAIVCLLWLRSRGKFFWNENDTGFETSLYFDEATGVLMYIRRDEFMSYIATASCINRESTTFKYVMSLIDDAALSPEVSQGVVPSKLWECKGETIYISSGDSEMYRVTPGKVEKVSNGTDGVVFLRKQTLSAWTLKDGGGLDPFDNALIFQGASFEDVHGRMVARLWFLNLFKVHRMKPPLLITGLFQSGKTRMAAAMKEILGMPDMSVQEAEDGDKGLDSFWATVNDGMFEIYDNLDTKIKWVPNTLQVAATNGQTKRRTLYTTFGVSVLRANAHLVITSNNPRFATELGLADRLQIVRLGRTRKTSSDLALTEDIVAKRDEFMTWTARILARALADTEPVVEVYNMRHPEFSNFAVRLGRACGCENDAIAAMKKAELDKSLLPLQDKNGLPIQILRVLIDKKGIWKFTANEMAQAIIGKMKESGETDDKTDTFVNSRKVGKALNDNMLPFSTLFKVLPRKTIHGTPTYTFNGIVAGVDFSSLKGELGGCETPFSENPIEDRNTIDFPETALYNSPNTPTHTKEGSVDNTTDMLPGVGDGYDNGGYDDDGFDF